MFSALSNDELVTFYAMMKRARNDRYSRFVDSFTKTDYNMVHEFGAIMNDLHLENSTR